MLTSFLATGTNNGSNGSNVNAKLADSCSLMSDSTLKFMCDICGTQMENLISLKSHIADHKQQQQPHSSNFLSSSSLSNTKLSSIIASTKNVSTPETNNKKNPFVINIPQTMKVFSVKDILTKLKNHNPNSANIPTNSTSTSNRNNSNNASVSNQTNTANCTKSDQNNNNVVISGDHSCTSIIQLEDLDKLVQVNSNGSENSSSGGGAAFNNFSSEQTPYHYSECENVYICNMCNSTYDSLRSIKAHLWKHSGHHKFSYPIHDYNNRTESTGKPITTLAKSLTNNNNTSSSDLSTKSSVKSPTSIHSDIHRNENQLNSKYDEKLFHPLMVIASKQLDFVEYDECDENNISERPRKKFKSSKAKVANFMNVTAASSSSNQSIHSPISSLSPASASPTSNSNRSCDGNMSGNVSSSSNNNNNSSNGCGGGGICSVLLEVIEKLRDAESSSSFLSTSSQIIDASNKVIDTASSKKVYNKIKNTSTDLNKKRKKNPSQLINTILNNNNQPGRIESQTEENGEDNILSNKYEQDQVTINGVKKQRKKRISKKLNQLIALNCGSNMSNSFLPIDGSIKEIKSNKIAMLIESQQKYLQTQTNENNQITNESNTPVVSVQKETNSTSTQTTAHASSSNVDNSPNEECTIETSIVNSLYDDGVSILGNLDSNVDRGQINSQNQLNEQEKSSTINGDNSINNNINISNVKSEDDVDFNFSYKNHNGVLLNDLNIKLIENSDDKDECNKRSFICFKCSLFFNDLLALCEHKSNCEKSFDQIMVSNSIYETTSNSNTDNSNNNKIKYYLCDLCHSKDPLNTVMSESNRAKANSYSKAINSYYLLNISDKKFYFKCFGDLDAINEHYKTEHQQHLSNKTHNFCKVGEEKTETSLKQQEQSMVPSPSNLPNFQSINSNQEINNNQNYSIISTSQCVEIKNLIESLATNDGGEQYVCGLCNYVCYHLPSLKSHMWTHVKHEKFDYSINTSIINAALDYENKLNRNMSSINLSIKNDLQAFLEAQQSQETTEAKNASGRVFLEKKLANILEMINYSETKKKLSHLLTSSNKPMVLFRCSKCRFETIDLCLLRLHKQDHYSKF